MAAQYAFAVSQYERSPKTVLEQEMNYVKSNMDSKESVLFNLQLIFLVDTSASMGINDVDPDGVGKDGLLGRGQWTRFDNMVKLLKAMTTDLLKFDKDGKLPCYFFNSTVERQEFTDPNMLVAQVRTMRPGGSTAMHLAFRESLRELNDIDNFLYIVFTDGEPDDQKAVSQFIETEIYAKDKGGDRINILFVRFGDDAKAMAYLQEQDDHPIYGDNVDTKSDNAAYVLGPKLLVLNAIYEELEKDPDQHVCIRKLLSLNSVVKEIAWKLAVLVEFQEVCRHRL